MTDRKAFVIGHPIRHSRSPLIHGYWLRQLGIAGSYEAVDVAPDDLGGFLGRMREVGYVGGNVTIPHKEAVARAVHETTALARRIGAVNTIWLTPDGQLVGHNTDASGFTAGLDAAFGAVWAEETEIAVVIGAGGAARAIVVGLLERGIARVVVANRDLGKAERLRELAPAQVVPVPLGDLPRHLGQADLLVNTTSLGMHGQPPLELDLAALPARARVSDIVYVPLETNLLAGARARGLRTANGLSMLLHQAVPGFEAWFGVRPHVTAELHALIAADVTARS
jgi:shikimate dehydrogenase